MSNLRWFKFWGENWLTEFDATSKVSLAAQGLWLRMIIFMYRGKPQGYLTDKNGKPLDPSYIVPSIESLKESSIESLLTELENEKIFSRDGDFIYSRKIVKEVEKSNQNRKNRLSFKESFKESLKEKANETVSSILYPLSSLEGEGGPGGEDDPPPISGLASKLAHRYVEVGSKLQAHRFKNPMVMELKAARSIETAFERGVTGAEILSALAYLEAARPAFWVTSLSDHDRLFTGGKNGRTNIQQLFDESQAKASEPAKVSRIETRGERLEREAADGKWEYNK